MGLSSTTKIVCDFVKEGKPCGKIFYLPDIGQGEPTKGAENTISMIVGATGQRFMFCSMLHAVAFGVNWIKQGPVEEPTAPQAKPAASKGVITMPTPTQIHTLENMGLVEPVEGIPPIEDLSI